MFVCCECRVL